MDAYTWSEICFMFTDRRRYPNGEELLRDILFRCDHMHIIGKGPGFRIDRSVAIIDVNIEPDDNMNIGYESNHLTVTKSGTFAVRLEDIKLFFITDSDGIYENCFLFDGKVNPLENMDKKEVLATSEVKLVVVFVEREGFDRLQYSLPADWTETSPRIVALRMATLSRFTIRIRMEDDYELELKGRSDILTGTDAFAKVVGLTDGRKTFTFLATGSYFAIFTNLIVEDQELPEYTIECRGGLVSVRNWTYHKHFKRSTLVSRVTMLRKLILL